MTLIGLALRNLSGNAFRSWVVFLCAALVSAFVLSATLIIRGAQDSLHLALRRLGADIVVVPRGAEARVESALLMGRPASAWMSTTTLPKIAGVPGVAAASPQLYLASLANASCCTASEMFVVAFEPATDFTITPWLRERLGGELGLGQVIGGTHVFTPPGERYIRLYGYHLTLKGNLEPTGTGLDQTMFLTFATARAVAQASRTMAEKPLEIPPDSISAVLVTVRPGTDARAVARRIAVEVDTVTPLASLDLFHSVRRQIAGLLQSVIALLGITWMLSLLVIGLIFSMAANERRREIGVLRALGAPRGFVLRSLLAEAGLLAAGGGLLGAALAGLAIYLFRDLLVLTLGMPFLLPSWPRLLALVAGGLSLALGTVTLAAWLPAYRTSRQDPALAMRE